MTMKKIIESKDNQPIGGDFNKNAEFDSSKEYDFDDELYEFKSALEELNGELEEDKD